MSAKEVRSRLPAVYVAKVSAVTLHLVSKNAWALSAAVFFPYYSILYYTICTTLNPILAYSDSATAMPVGGQEEADRAYHEAMHAVFTAQVDCHRHSQPFSRKKDGKVRWAMLEMWPMLVGA